MLILLSALLSSLCSMFRSRAALELENVALRHQIGVLKRSARKRLKLTNSDRLFWVFLSQGWRDWRSALDIVKPPTAIRLAPQRVSPFLTNDTGKRLSGNI
jgi:putative transposase